ncbi:GAF and ANTAR domain-containing protein [Actinoplanes sp. NBRC 103695]|uniref:GAF and ANTAR domain-containing protein n=1 Tax=Actinoplanes sp. NBRC 103695 TaxID=3032202 RepID=UPI0024A401E7|nr:GAF and ANTAR domain-containing protein [Actinoplanes sp. NBRC 103695]GLZ00679.1 GAF domain-containing protein [Actinoplanes sp. NBRC 103695]
MDDRKSVIADLVARQPAEPAGTAGLLRRVCRAAAKALSASGTGLSVMTEDGVRAATAASDPISERIEDLQFVLGEGPCMDAFASRRPVLVPDLDELGCGAGSRWPFYAPAARRDGLRAVFAFPLQVGAARLGVMDVFRERAGPLSGEELADALDFAEVTVAALLDQQEDTGRGGVPAVDDGDDIGLRSELFQAQGMVMVQLEVSLVEAMARIRAYAYAEDRHLADVARDIVARRLSFDRDIT